MMGRKSLLGCVFWLAAATGAHAEWYEASSKHFVVYADDKPERIKAYTERLERYDAAVRVMRGVQDSSRGPSARVSVYQLADLSDIRALYGKGGGSVGGFYQNRSTGPVAFVPRSAGGSGSPYELSAERILLHEYAHHFMYADWPAAIFPKWFVEGFAEYNSTAMFNPDGSVTFGAPPTDRGWGVADVNAMPLSRMLDPGLGNLDGRQTYALYSRGWALTHYLTQDAERRKQLAAYVQAINEGKPYTEAAKVFGNVNALDFKLVSYVKSPRFQSQVIPADKIHIGDVTVRKLAAGEAASMPMRIRSQRGVWPERAKEVAADARAAAARFPNDAAAQNELAEAEFDVDNYAAAAAAADRALAADPKSVHAMVYKGMALQGQAAKEKSTDAKRWNEVRRWYIAANRVDTEDPTPLVLFYRSFRAAGQPATPSAQKGMLYAAALAPYALDLTPDTVAIHLQQGNVAEARRALQRLAYNPHGGKQANKLRDVLETLDTKGVAAAKTQFDALGMEGEPEDKAGREKEGASG